MRLGYLYSRYPVLSQTFCDTEMLELERRGWSLFVGSVHPPLTTLRHAHANRLQAPVHYAPPDSVLHVWEDATKAEGNWPAKLIERHEQEYGFEFKPALRARNACYFAEQFEREGIQHFHVHFANRAAHTALFLKRISGISFSITAHGQDFMSDLGSESLLREICDAAEFVAVETDFSRQLLSEHCSESAGKIHRVYNGMDLDNFAEVEGPTYSQGPVRILSVGRLVEFKGFEHLIAACAELRRRQLDFTCEIIGDGPLRESLKAEIAALGLGSIIVLSGSLPQQTVFRKLQNCDFFVLASVVDRAGASDVFPTVILEAMASAKAVVATQLAGIPEAVVHSETGFLVPPADGKALADAMDRLIRDQWMRTGFGNAGRARVAEEFLVERTIEPLVELLERVADDFSGPRQLEVRTEQKAVGYLIDEWPSPYMPLLENELAEMEKRGVAIVPFVCQLAPDAAAGSKLHELATRLRFLPDPMVIEAEWHAHRAQALELEDLRANDKHRAPSALFLQQARYAIALQSYLRHDQITHLHATGSRALPCAIMLKRLLGITISATIEPGAEMPVRALRAALAQCEGGRVSDAKLSAHLSNSFLLESASATLLRTVGLGSRGGTWQQWADLLQAWR